MMALYWMVVALLMVMMSVIGIYVDNQKLEQRNQILYECLKSGAHAKKCDGVK